MKNISKVLRQLPEKPLRWLLQDFMKDGIPTQFEDFKNGQCEYFIHNFKLEVVGRFIYLAGNEIYDIENSIRILKPITWRDPTQEEVNAIYEEVKEVKCVTDLGDIDIFKIETLRYSDFRGWYCDDSSDCYMSLFQKGAGFALPISWKEEDPFAKLEGQKLDTVLTSWEKVSNTDKEHLQWIFNRLVNVHKENPKYDYMVKFKDIIDGNDTNVATIEETPEQKAKRIEDANITELFKRVQALENEKVNVSNRLNVLESKLQHEISQSIKEEIELKLTDKEQPVKEFKVGDKVVVNEKYNEKYNKNFKLNHKGVITEIDHTNFPFEIDGYSWVKQDEIQHAPKEVESGDCGLPEGFKVYKCTDCGSLNVKKNNFEVRVGFCDDCDHPLWN